jgi:RNA polymerase sigma factor (TIGR02999 family)
MRPRESVAPAADDAPTRMSDPTQHVEHLLAEIDGGDASAVDRLLPLVYDELHGLAVRHLARQRAGHTLQPTALVHEAYLRLARRDDAEWAGKAHFLAVAAKAMRQILLNHARDRAAAKRGGDLRRVTLDPGLVSTGERDVDLLALDGALERLARLSERQARVVELRFFGGLTIAETARVLGVGTTTVEDDWFVAKAWMARELEPDAAP